MDLVTLDYNPRKLTEKAKAKLVASLEKFNLVEIPVINTDNTLVAGNQRVHILMDVGRGTEEIDVRIPNRELTEQELKEYNITSNTHVGIWDVEKLAEVFEEVVDLGELGLMPDVLKEIDGLNLDYSDKNKEIDIDGFGEKITIVLSYDIERYEQIIMVLNQGNGSIEDNFWNILKEKGLFNG